MQKDNTAYLRHILDAIVQIEKYTEKLTLEKFQDNRLVVDAVIRNLEIIGEASGKVQKEFREKYPEVPWRSIIGLRNVLIHDYLGVDVPAVWMIVNNSLASLKAQVSAILDKESPK